MWENVVGTWLGFLEEQRRWERGVESQIDGIMGVVWRDDEDEVCGNDLIGGVEYRTVENQDWNEEGKGKGKERENWIVENEEWNGEGKGKGKERENWIVID